MKYRIQVTTDEGLHHWNSQVGMFGWREPHSPTIFDSLKAVEEKMRELQSENPSWFVQRKLVK